MKNAIKILLGLLLVITITTLDIGATYTFQYPFSIINIIFAVLIIIMMWCEHGIVVWLAFCAHLFIELFAVTPFGIILLSSTLGMLAGYWLYTNIFTNKSWYTAIVMTLITITIYRTVYIVLYLLYLFLNSLIMPNAFFFSIFFWEIILTSLSVGIIFIMISPFSEKLSSMSVSSNFLQFNQ